MLVEWAGDKKYIFLPIIFILIVTLIITAVSNGANITDGIDGLATGTSAIVGTVLAVLAYVSGNTVFANYLNIMYIPNVGELMVFMSAFVGASTSASRLDLLRFRLGRTAITPAIVLTLRVLLWLQPSSVASRSTPYIGCAA